MFNAQQINRFLSSIALFEEMDPNSIQPKLLSVPLGCVMIVQGDKEANEMFILVKGAVSIHRSDNPPKQKIPQLHHYFEGVVSLSTQFNYDNIDQYGTNIAIINKSKSVLGEQAILTKKPRAVSVITSVESIFIVIQSKDCEQCLQSYQSEEIQKKSILNISFPQIFDSPHYSGIFKEKVYRLFRSIKTSRNQIINNNSKDYIYIVLQGEFAIEILKQRNIYRQICIVHKGSLIGEEIAFGEHNYLYRAICQSYQGLLLYFSLKDLLSVISIEQIPILENHYQLKKQLLKQNSNYNPINNIQEPTHILNKFTAKLQLKQKLHNQIQKNSKLKCRTDFMAYDWFQPHQFTKRQLLEYSGKVPILLGLHNRNKMMVNSTREKNSNALAPHKKTINMRRALTVYQSVESPREFQFMTNTSGFMPSSLFSRQLNKRQLIKSQIIG